MASSTSPTQGLLSLRYGLETDTHEPPSFASPLGLFYWPLAPPSLFNISLFLLSAMQSKGYIFAHPCQLAIKAFIGL